MPDASILPTAPLPTTSAAHFFASIFDNRGQPWRGPLTRLVERLTNFPVRRTITDKRQLPSWSPRVDWTRAADAHVHALVLDVDGGASIEDALARCSAWALVLHTSWSHKAENARFRVILPLARPVPSDRWAACWLAAAETIGLPIDASCKDHRRRYFLPAKSADDAPASAVSFLDRPALDLLALPPQSPTLGVVRLPPPPVRLPWYLADTARAVRLRRDPETRRKVAESLDLTLSPDGNRATGAVCPSCGRPSVWFLVSPQCASNARCNHANSCGWNGPLTCLLAG